MRNVVFTALFVLAACDGPAPKYFGGVVREVSIDDSRFRVFMEQGGHAVSAHRISIEALPSLSRTLEKGYRAIELATGCAIVPDSLHGDVAIILADVNCVLP